MFGSKRAQLHPKLAGSGPFVPTIHAEKLAFAKDAVKRKNRKMKGIRHEEKEGGVERGGGWRRRMEGGQGRTNENEGAALLYKYKISRHSLGK